MTKSKQKGKAVTAFAMIKRLPKTREEWFFWLKRKGGQFFLSVLRYALILCIGLIILMPILKLISGTFMSPEEVGSPVSTWIPSKVSAEHLDVAFKLMNYPAALGYTLFTTGMQMVLQILASAVTGYSFARVRSKKIQKLFGIVILSIVVPPSVLMMPQYFMFQNFEIFGLIKLLTGRSGLLERPITVYLLDICGMGLKSGLYIFIFRQFFRGLPKELEEAAHMDGCGFLKTLFRIIMPNAMPGIITVGVLSFVWNWNDTQFANMFVQSKLNLMVKLNAVAANMDQDLNAIKSKVSLDYYFEPMNPLYQGSILTASSLLVVLPLIVLYMFVQKRFVESASNAGIVG